MALQWRGKVGLHGRELRQPWAGSSLRSPMTHLLLPSPSIVVPSHHLTSPTPTPSTHKYLIHSLPQIVAQQSHTVWNFPKIQKRIFSKKVVEVYPKGSLTLPIKMFLRIVKRYILTFLSSGFRGVGFGLQTFPSHFSAASMKAWRQVLAGFGSVESSSKLSLKPQLFGFSSTFQCQPLLPLKSLCFIL